jgi:hypothetical protein
MKKTNGLIASGGYKSFFRIGFIYEKSKGKAKYRGIYDILIRHGSGSGKSMAKFQKLAMSYDVNLFWEGHTHYSLVDPSIPLTQITKNGNIIVKNRQAIMTPSYTNQINMGDHLDFTDRYPLMQSKSAFGLLTLTPMRPKGKTKADFIINVDLQMKTLGGQEQIYGELE